VKGGLGFAGQLQLPGCSEVAGVARCGRQGANRERTEGSSGAQGSCTVYCTAVYACSRRWELPRATLYISSWVTVVAPWWALYTVLCGLYIAASSS
jgi:hypothetical protein